MNSAYDASAASRPGLNESQVRHVLGNFEHADKLLSEIEGILTAASSKTAFPKFVGDITPAQTRMVEAYVARLRTQMLRVLDSIGGQPGRPAIGALRAIRVHLTTRA